MIGVLRNMAKRGVGTGGQSKVRRQRRQTGREGAGHRRIGVRGTIWGWRKGLKTWMRRQWEMGIRDKARRARSSGQGREGKCSKGFEAGGWGSERGRGLLMEDVIRG